MRLVRDALNEISWTTRICICMAMDVFKRKENIMLKITFKKCCNACLHRVTNVKEDKIYSDNKVFDVITTISCEHEQVCGRYNNDKGE